MQAPFELDTGLSRLRAIIEAFPKESVHWNEAENRFQFVDRLLTECLGWTRPAMKVEVYDEAGGRSDYLLGSPIQAVVEAKKEAVHFGDLPLGKPTTVRKLKPLVLASNNLRYAVTQVLQYCALNGAPLAVVCNGPQLLVFQALTPGSPPLDGDCFFFNGFDSYIDHFALLWTLLSPEGVKENRARRQLAQHRISRLPTKASEVLTEPNRFRYRNGFQENLRGVSSLLLEEIEDNPSLKRDFYRDCYVPLEANNRSLLLSKQVIASRYKRVSDDGITPISVYSTPNGAEEALSIGNVTALGINTSRPIVVIGDVGVGKTAFFENLFEQVLRAQGQNSIYIQIDLGTKANLSSTVKSYVLNEVPRVLQEAYSIEIFSKEFAKAVYYKEMQKFAKGPKGDLANIDSAAYEKAKIDHLSTLISTGDTHLHACLAHLSRGQGKHIILVIDNADQRTFEVQQEAFLIAQEFAATRNLFVFVALRPSTFYQSKLSGALAAYQNRVLTISPPPADEVVLRRLAFAVRVAEGKVAPAALPDIRLQLGSIVSFFNATLRSIRTNEEIRQFLANITGGNTRGVIELITAFFGSPNVDSEKIVRIELERNNYIVPLHEFTKHALLGDYAYYNAQSSQVACNIYDVSSADPREHFLSSLIICFLASNAGQRDNDGFMLGDAVTQEMLRQGYSEDQTRWNLARLASKRLIETPHAHYRELKVDDRREPSSFHYRATSSGIYHVRSWSASFSFLDAVSTDTPVFDEASRAEIASLAPSFQIEDRYKKTTCFRAYLETQWYTAAISANYYDFIGITTQQSTSFMAVERALNAAARRPPRRHPR